jgi:dolichyl-phosphate-mannose-protein mannosyltransferase
MSFMNRLLRTWFLSGLLVLSVVLHLVALNYPSQVIFDEVHFGKFINSYCCTGERFFDIHPPHVKLLVAGAVALTDYDGSFSFEHIGQPYDSGVPVWAFRIVPALAGILLPFLIYLLLRQVGVREELSLLAALAVVLDNALLLQTRIIALDGVLLVAQFGALVAYLASRTRSGWNRMGFLLLSGTLCGLAAGSKFTGLAILLLIGLWWLYELWNDRFVSWKRFVIEGVFIVAVALLIYGLGWWIHYAILPHPGSGDVWQIPSGNVLMDTIEMHRKMLSANYNLAATHVYSSVWWTWPVMARPIFYWQGQNAGLYFLGNPAVWWGSFLLLLVVLVQVVWAWVRGRMATLPGGGWLFLIGYVIALLPFIRIPRALFLYHYATPLLFSLLLGFVYLGSVWPKEPAKARQVYIGAVIGIVTLFILFSPLTFGFVSGDTWRTLLYWFPTWR